jgi:site-specific DNA recombinase
VSTPFARWSWVDLRLVPVAASVWLTTLLAPLAAPFLLGSLALAVCVLAVLAGRHRRPATALILTVLAGVAVASSTAAVRGAVREGSPLRAVAEAGRTASVVLALDGEPHVLRGAGPPRVVADATVTLLVDGPTAHRLRAGVLLFGPADEWARVLPGQRVRVRVGLSLPERGDDVVAVVSARGPPTPVGEPGTVQRAAGALRQGLSDSAQRVLEPGPAGLLPGLAVGDTGEMDPVLEEDFRRAGLAHLTAVSGDTVSNPLYCPSVRAVIYTRVSSDPNDRGRSVAEQEVECRGVCERNGWDVVGLFSDNDRSASRYATKVRPQYKRLIESVEAGGCDVLVTWEASRAQRDLMAYARLRDLFERKGVLLSYSGRTYDMSEADDRFGTGLDALLAERESDQTRKRVLRAVRSNATKGRPHGRLLYGYRREYNPETRELIGQVLDEQTAPIVREAARRVLAGETPYAVAQDFNRRGVPTPTNGGRGWDLTQIRRLCVNPGYASKRVHQGKVVGEATWPPILDEATHHGLVARLSDPKRRTQRDSAIRHLLSGVALCGVCNGRIRVQKNRGFLAYLCVDGFHVSRREELVDVFVEAVTVARLERSDMVQLVMAEDDYAVAVAIAEAREKRGRLDGFCDAAAAGELSPAALSRIEASLLPEIAAAEKRAQRAALSPVVADTAGPDAAERWARLSLPPKREIIRTLMTVRIMPTKRGARSFDPEHIEISWKTS